MIHTVKGFSAVNEAEVDVYLEFSSFSDDLTDVGNLNSGSSTFSKSSLNLWEFSVQVLLKPGLYNFVMTTVTFSMYTDFSGGWLRWAGILIS